MAFDTSTSDQRVELLRQAEKTANLTRRVTIGSGVMDDAAKAQGDALCGMLESALADIGYGGIPPGGAVVMNGEAKPVLKAGGVPLVVGSTRVGSEVLDGIEIPSTAAVVQDTNSIQVRESNNTTVVSSSCPATVADNAVSYVSLPATMGVLTNNAPVPVQNSSGTAIGSNSTAIVSSGKVKVVRMPATTALVVSSTDPIAIPVTGTYTTSVSFTVANGAITGITLS